MQEFFLFLLSGFFFYTCILLVFFVNSIENLSSISRAFFFVRRTFAQLQRSRQVIGTHAAWTTLGNAFLLLDRGRTRSVEDVRLAEHE